MKRRTIRFRSFADEIITNKGQDYVLPPDYRWLPKGRAAECRHAVVYAAAYLFSVIYCGIILHTRVKNRHILASCRGRGYFLYGNHTQMVGDAFLPAFACFGRRTYVVVSPANLGLPVLGRLLPSMGALPIPEIERMREFICAVETRARQGNVIVTYPEAHVWPFYTGIRPFGTAAFHHPARCGMPVFCMTTTYQKRRFGSRPKLTVYLDGPFTAEGCASLKEKKVYLRDRVYACMKERSKNSTYAYWTYDEYSLLR